MLRILDTSGYMWIPRGTTCSNPKYDIFIIPSGELTFCYGKSPFLMGKSTISMAIYTIAMLVHQAGYTSRTWPFSSYKVGPSIGLVEPWQLLPSRDGDSRIY